MYSMGSSNRPGHTVVEMYLMMKPSLLQAVTPCSPEKEECVTNQTLRSENCLVPCVGLYADITDDTLKQNMVTDRTIMRAGLEAISEELGTEEQKTDIKAVLRQLFSNTAAEEDVNDVETLTKAYRKYKRQFVKHLFIAPEGKHLG